MLQAQLQPETPPEVHAQRATTIQDGVTDILASVTYGSSLLDKGMGIWTSGQIDALVKKINQELCVKEQEFDDLQEVLPTLIPAQRMTCLQTNQALQGEVEALRRQKEIVTNHIKPWAKEAMQLSQDLDVVVHNLNQTMKKVTSATEGPPSELLVETMQSTANQGVSIFPPLAAAIEVLKLKMKTPLPL